MLCDTLQANKFRGRTLLQIQRFWGHRGRLYISCFVITSSSLIGLDHRAFVSMNVGAAVLMTFLIC